MTVEEAPHQELYHIPTDEIQCTENCYKCGEAFKTEENPRGKHTHFHGLCYHAECNPRQAPY